MQSDASTFPPGGAPAGERPLGLWRWRVAGPVRDRAGAKEGVLQGTLALASIVALSLFVVLIAANRPSILTPTTHTGYFPHWMAGPLGGLLPGFTANGTTLKYLFTGALVVMYVAYMLALKRAPTLSARWVIGAIVAVHVIYLLAPPMALTDLFNYVNYGRMEVVHGLNPYTTIPVLEPHDDPSYMLSNWHELLSPYGPLFTLLTFVVVPLGVAGSFWALKAILMLTSLATILLVWKCARLLGRDPRAAIALVGLNPIVLVWGLGGDHNDFLMVFWIMLAFYLLLRARTAGVGEQDSVPGETGAVGEESAVGEPLGVRVAGAVAAPDGAATAGGASRASAARAAVLGWIAELRSMPLRELLLPLSGLEVGSGAALMTAAAIKASAAILFPAVLVILLRAPRTLLQVLVGMVIAGVVLGAASLLAFGLHVPDLSTQSSLVTSESIPNLIGLAAGAGGESSGLRSALSVVLVAVVFLCAWLAWRRRDALTASGWAGVALLVTLSWVLPWYVLWVLPFAALSRSRRLRVTVLVLGVYLIVAWAPASGLLWNAISFHPQTTSLGRLHQRYVKELLN
jgi:hypothetical protein